MSRARYFLLGGYGFDSRSGALSLLAGLLYSYKVMALKKKAKEYEKKKKMGERIRDRKRANDVYTIVKRQKGKKRKDTVRKKEIINRAKE